MHCSVRAPVGNTMTLEGLSFRRHTDSCLQETYHLSEETVSLCMKSVRVNGEGNDVLSLDNLESEKREKG